jgi:hypothetical protein
MKISSEKRTYLRDTTNHSLGKNNWLSGWPLLACLFYAERINTTMEKMKSSLNIIKAFCNAGTDRCGRTKVATLLQRGSAQSTVNS